MILFAAIGYYASCFFIAILFDNSSLDTIILLGFLCIMLSAYLVKRNLNITLRIEPVFYYYIALALFFYLSGLWAMDRSTAIWWGTEILEITFGLAIIAFSFSDEDSVEKFIQVITIGGYCVVIYAIISYGWSTLTSYLGQTSRISNDAINANSLGMSAAYTIVGNVYFILKKKIKWWTVLAVPSVVVLIATGSRKALFISVIGSVLLIMELNQNKKGKAFKLLRNVFFLLIFAFLFKELADSDAFIGIGERVKHLIAGLLGKGASDDSTTIRLELIEMGMDIFKKHPILGLGIDNAKFIAGPMFGLEEYYLHNNYVVLLADVGIVGFVLYYSIYLVLLIKYLKYRDFSSPEYCFCFTLLVIMLMMDYGMVSFQSKETYFYLLVLSREAEIISNNYKRKRLNHERN